MLVLSISYPYLIKFHDFADNIQEGMKQPNVKGRVQLSPNRAWLSK
jgi:hypothetical protein